MSNFNYTFHFSFFPLFSVFLVSLIMWRIFVIFQVSYTFLVVLFPFLKRTLYNTWKSHYRQVQVLILIFNEKALVKIPSISDSKNPPWNLLSFASKTIVNECHRNNVRICFSLCFHNNTHFLDLPSLAVSSRGLFRTVSNIQYGAFCENS